MALAIAAGAVGAAPSASAQATDEIPEHSGEVTIAARHATALQGIDNLVFTVTREVAADYDLEVPVTLSPGIIDAERLSHTVTIEANRASARLSVNTRTLHPGAATGDVTASVGGGGAHDVGDPSTASVRLHIGQTLVTVSLNAGAYEIPESVGETTDEVLVVARTQPGIPAPHSAIHLFVASFGGTAHPLEDFLEFLRPHTVPGESQADWVADGDAWMLETRAPVRIVGDDVDEEDETVSLTLLRPHSEAPTVRVARADSTALRCGSSSCKSVLTIVDDDTRGVSVRPAGPLRVEEGKDAFYTVVLNSRPTSEVTITPVVRDAAGANISVDQVLTFTPRSWHSVQWVAVKARDDGNVLNGSATIAHTVAGGDYGANGVTAASVPVVEEDSAEPPAKPTGLTADIVSHDTVTLTWDNPGDDTITGYAILRRDNAIHPENTLQTIQTDTGTAATTYTDNTARPSREYMYHIRAINAAGDGDISNSVRAYTVAAPPAGLVSEVSHNSVTLRWDNPGDDAVTGYVILRRDKAIHPEGTFETIRADTATAQTTYTDKTAQPDREYVYRIKAINAHGTSEISDWVRAYTPAAP